MRFQLKAALAAIVMAGSLMATSVANATTVNFTFKNGAADVATGWFSYNSANPVITFSDLTAFDLQIGANHYDLNFVNSAPYNENTFFEYDVGIGFGHAPQPGLFNIDTTMVAMSNGFAGFIFTYDPANRYYTDLSVSHQPWTDVVFQTVPAPEPMTLSLFGAGLVGAGALRRLRKKAR